MARGNYIVRKNRPIHKDQQSKSWYYRIKIALGLLLQGSSMFLTLSCLSYLWHSQHDQHMVEQLLGEGFKQAHVVVHNMFGILGAMASYYLIYLWFGIAIFLVLPVCCLFGLRMVWPKICSGIFLLRFTIISLFFALWVNILVGYLSLLWPKNVFLLSCVGGIGHEFGLFFKAFLNYGTILFLVIALSIFVVCFFNIPALALLVPWNFFRKRAMASQAKSSQDESVAYDDQDNGPHGDDTAALEDKGPALEHGCLSDNATDDRGHIRDLEDDDNNQGVDFEVVEPLSKDHDPCDEPVECTTVSDKDFVAYDSTLDLSDYKYPPLSLLNQYEHTLPDVTVEELETNKQNIIATLNNFKIQIAKIKATIGPTVTLYEIVPEAGVKISKIKSLEDDIALNLSALGIRIIAPIPGKGTIGIEVPNKYKAIVPLRNMLACEEFAKTSMELPVILGKSISNEVVFADLTRMPHLLIAGATGQGKSVGLNVLLCSLIYKKHPSQLKLVLVDPKKVELSLYNKLERHFLAKLPQNEEAIITETKTVVHTLNSLCIEMDQRYELLKEAGTRSIREYNEKFVKRVLLPQEGHRFLPYIVLVIDEFADMMMTSGKEVELPIARLAQLARAVGIHLVLATQRPSVNVITGIIKANFPVRISYRVTSKIDSRTILDTSGAEQLVGNGDLLLSMNSDIIRLQCPFLDTEEVDRICDYIGMQRGYTSAYALPIYDDESQDMDAKQSLEDLDPLFEDAARLVVLHQQGSTSLIQRKLKLGYNRSGRIIDQLEEAGVVGPFEGSKAREVLIQDEVALDALLTRLNIKS